MAGQPRRWRFHEDKEECPKKNLPRRPWAAAGAETAEAEGSVDVILVVSKETYHRSDGQTSLM